MVKSRHLALTCVDSDFCITAIFFFGFALKLSPMPPQKNKCRPIGFCGFQTPQWRYRGGWLAGWVDGWVSGWMCVWVAGWLLD